MLVALVTVLLSVGRCPTASAGPDDAAPGPVDIGSGRSLFLDCQGTGGPTVFVIPGQGSYAEAWNHVVATDDPTWASPYDVIEQARLVPSPTATQPTVARTTRICVYDRPGTRPDGDRRSTPVAQPHSAQQDVDDLVALIGSAGLPGPFVFVAHSYGGLVLDLLARRHPELVAGLVFVEPTSEFLTGIGTPAQNAAFYADSRGRGPDAESVLMEESFAEVASAPPLPRVPASVLSADRFPPPDQLTPDNYTQAQIRQANDMLAAALGTADVVVPHSGHNMMLYQPQVVAEAIEQIVERVRSGR
ncbi:putative hydrolase or acyltransferase of alpha/beta superfamily [Mycolicibacterium chubuense NBB4]|uniref:Putative hydrolase or acyltransferase of alpha/beta superfamily n=1 Tax=Mycolicibacterium chubuense (strain NBB4) TaxID=710421 RepID=I4BIH4_MYCCN|nr:putative hydrolase or acyltransferase of alpha/beta superfamily [Mycolicibacterium chubuense NBB4]